MSYAQLPYLYTNPYSVVEPYMDYYSYYYGPQYQYEYYNYAKDRYDDYVRNKSQKELEEIKLMRQKIEKLAKTAKEKDQQIELEARNLEKEKEVVLQRLNDAKRREELANYERERIEDAKKNLQYRYSAIPRYSDLYPHPYFREFYGGPVHSQPPIVHHSYNAESQCHNCCEERHIQTPQRCKSCYKEKTTYILPPIKQYAASPPSYY